MVYELTTDLAGSGTADVTFSTATGGTSQQRNVSVPLYNKNGTLGLRQRMQPGSFAYFSAQNTGHGTLTCTIREGRQVLDRETSSGRFAIVTCQGTV